ncbi:sigma-70 family RNA polymerase sigma factor [Gemmata sp. JC673]|uniref:Sigma-70 family RNA polymerase sigma factor n=1 Tax=Gemmata algarum TaxID=2975278 RepID=A0ABU5ERX5_9BACT|nr:sigma-70 family RNA polymerase sigma factor [Gemmata algarum]MDY3558097.1 sigma-70 family RNA polymerase sigma factor [Gemmata algarum]
MAGVRLAALVRKLRRDAVFDSGGDSDAELLARFASARDELAFELLVWRHGAMVLAACRRALGHTEDAEDAFQATFLVLARKAHAVRRGTAVPAWLHRVAMRITHRLAAGRRPTTTLATEPAARATPDAAELHELRGMLDAEIDRLSEPYRRAFVLCYLEGLSNADAARELGCPVGTIESRLTAARRTLRTRLARRLPLPAGVLAALGFLPTLSATAVAEVKRAAAVAAARGLRAAIGIAREPVVRLAERAMIMTKLQKWAAGTLSLALFGLAIGIGWAHPTAEPPEAPKVVTAHPVSAPPDTPVQLDSAPPPKPVEPKPKDTWPLAWRRTLDGYGHLIGVTPDGGSLLMRHDRGVNLIPLTGNNARTFSSVNNVSGAALSADGKFVAIAEGINGVKIRDRMSGRVVEALWPSGNLPAQQVAFTPDGAKLIALCGRTSTDTRRKGAAGGPRLLPLYTSVSRISVWDVGTWKEVSYPEQSDTYFIGLGSPLVLAAGGRFAIRTQEVFEDGAERQKFQALRFSITNTATGTESKPLTLTNPVLVPARSCPVSPDGKTLVMSNSDGNELHFLSSDTGQDQFRIPAFRRPVKAVAFSPDGKLVAAATGLDVRGNEIAAPSEVVIWNTATGKEVARLVDKESIRDYSALAFGPDGSFLAAQTRSGSGWADHVMVWGRLPAPEPTVEPAAPAKPAAKGLPPAPDRFQALFRELSATAVTDARRVEVLFLAALGRFPTDVEARTLAAQLARSSDKAAALRELLGTLTETAEFRAHAAELQRMVK